MPTKPLLHMRVPSKKPAIEAKMIAPRNTSPFINLKRFLIPLKSISLSSLYKMELFSMEPNRVTNAASDNTFASTLSLYFLTTFPQTLFSTNRLCSKYINKNAKINISAQGSTLTTASTRILLLFFNIYRNINIYIPFITGI